MNTPCYPNDSGGCWVCGNNGTEPCQYPEMPSEFKQIAVMLARAKHSNPSQDDCIAMLEKSGTSRQKNLADKCFSEIRKAFDKLQSELGQMKLF